MGAVSTDSCTRALRESARGGAEERGGTTGTTASDFCAARAEVGRRREERSAMPGGAGGWAVGAGVSAVRRTGGTAGWACAAAPRGLSLLMGASTAELVRGGGERERAALERVEGEALWLREAWAGEEERRRRGCTS